MRSWARAAFWVAAALLYLACLRAYYVGFFNDDAFYVIGARALASLGAYVELNSPDLRPLFNYPPGYALLLAPWGVLTGDSLPGYQLLSVALTLLAVLLLRRLLSEEPQRVGWAAAAAFAFSPATASLSGVILSEVPYLAATLGALWLCRRHWAARSPLFWAAVGALAGYAALLRLTGAALGLALVGCLLSERRWKAAVAAAAAALAVGAPYYVWVRLAQGQGETRTIEMLEPYRARAAARLLACAGRGLPFYARELFGRALFRWPGGGAVEGLLAALAAATALVGVRAWGLRGWRKVAVSYAACYALVHLAWPYLSGRYAYPALPLACLFLFVGAAELERRLRRPGLVLGALALSLALSSAPVARVVLASARGRGPLNRPPERSYAWIGKETPPAALFAANLDGRLFLLAGRRCLHLPTAGGLSELAAWADRQGVDYVLAEDLAFYMRREAGGEARRPLEAGELARALPGWGVAFSDAGEGTVIFARARPTTAARRPRRG